MLAKKGDDSDTSRSPLRVVDLYCGAGFLTRSLRAALPDPETVVMGVDTSPEMVAMAAFITQHDEYMRPYFGLTSLVQQNNRRIVSESYRAMKRRGYAMREPPQSTKSTSTLLPHFCLADDKDSQQLANESFDLVTVMYDTPTHGRAKLLQQARRLLSPGGILAVVDTCTDPLLMTSMLNALRSEVPPCMHDDCHDRNGIHLSHMAGFEAVEYQEIVPRRLGLWTLRRSSSVPCAMAA